MICRARSRRRGGAAASSAGFTLPELLVVIVVAAVLALLAVPSLVSLVQTNRVDAAANQFIATLSMARSEAVKTGCAVTVSPSLPPLPPGNWGFGGWTVQLSSTCPTNPLMTLQTVPAITGQMTMYASQPSINFNSMGQYVGAAGILTPEADFIFCADGVNATYPMAQGVTLTASGRVRLADHPAGTPLENNETTTMACNRP